MLVPGHEPCLAPTRCIGSVFSFRQPDNAFDERERVIGPVIDFKQKPVFRNLYFLRCFGRMTRCRAWWSRLTDSRTREGDAQSTNDKKIGGQRGVDAGLSPF